MIDFIGLQTGSEDINILIKTELLVRREKETLKAVHGFM